MRHRAVRLPGPPRRRHHRDLRGAGDPTHVAALRFDLRLPACHSLKEKRAVVRPILDGARHRYSVAAAEVGHQDKWQRASLGMAAVGGSVGHVADVLDAVERFVWSFPEVEVIETERSWADADA
ncbi:MAG TPA: DUF503 domain-containing protein [Acidimicrobiales bacterium]|nr:DUF503 domain-containing protein [Acidimicrobiales bacterium]